MKLSNKEMTLRLQSLDPLMKIRGRVGYAACRNYRRLADSLTEFETRRVALIQEYGEADENGNITVDPGSPNFEKVAQELSEYAEIEHEVEIMMLPIEEAADVLTGRELMATWWMFKEEE